MHDDLKAILKKNNASLTGPRKLVFDLLTGHEPQDMKSLVIKTSGKLDRATVYRTIELFESLGIVSRLNIGWKHKYELSDVFHGHHHHFYCTACGRTYSLPANSVLETMINSTVSRDGFAPRGHQLEIYGSCIDCSKV